MTPAYRYIRRISLPLLFLCATLSAAAAQDTTRISYGRLFDLVMNYIGENDESDGIDVEYLQERLLEAYRTPIDWNNATRARLDDLLFLPDAMVENLLYYADVYGPVRSLSELAMVPGIDAPMRLILPHILTVGEPADTARWSSAFGHTSHTVSVRTDFVAERRAGFVPPDAAYPGADVRAVVKYGMAAGDCFSAAVTMESDAGEPWAGRGARGFDLYRLYAQAGRLPHIDRIVAGSYRASFGQGLLFGNMSYGNRTYRVLNSAGSYGRVSGYSGVSEAPSLFGVAAMTSFDVGRQARLNVAALYGYTPIDADTSGGEWHSIIETGYHRTDRERERRASLSLHTVGADVSVSARHYDIGLTMYGGFFSLPAVAASAETSALDFTGDRQLGASVHYMLRGRGVRLTGETAVQHTGAIATVNTLHVSVSSSVMVAVSHRYLSPRYHSFWASVPVAVGNGTAEHGGAFAMKVPLAEATSLSLSADVFRPRRSTTVTSTADIGYEVAAEIKSVPTSTVGIDARLRYRVRPRWERPDGAALNIPVTERVGLAQVAVAYGVAQSWSMKSGGQMNVAHSLPPVRSVPSVGALLYQDAVYQPAGIPLSVRGRLSYNYAPQWDNRFYLYEYDVPGSGYSPVLYGESLRWSLLARYSLPFGLTLSARISQSLYFDRDTISSGNDKIDANHRTDFHIYMAYSIK